MPTNIDRLGRPEPDPKAKLPKGYHGWAIIDGTDGAGILQDLTEIFRSSTACDDQYARGVCVGVISTLVATGMTFENAAKLLWQFLPPNTHYGRVPTTWANSFTGKYDPATEPIGSLSEIREVTAKPITPPLPLEYIDDPDEDKD